jgi:hypothetical protein
LDALAGLSDAPPEQLQEEIARLEAAKQAKAPKRERTLDELIAALPPMPEDIRNLVVQLARFYESKLFLQNLRDAEEFLRRRGAASKKFKSRRNALGPVLKALSEMSVSELESLVAQHINTTGQSDYAILANQLMGKKR